MSAPAFHVRTLAWLRSSQRLRTSFLPGEVLPAGPAGGTRVHGYFIRPSSAGALAFAAICAWTLASMLSMFQVPRTARRAAVEVERIGYAIHGLGVGCLVAAEVTRRRSRTPALVELRAHGSLPATRESIVALSTSSQGATTWLVSEDELSSETLLAAHEHGVSCFVGRHDAPFTPRSTARSRHGPSLGHADPRGTREPLRTGADPLSPVELAGGCRPDRVPWA